MPSKINFSVPQCDSEYDLKARLFEPFMQRSLKDERILYTSTGRGYRICSCCGEICFIDQCDNNESHHSNNHPHIGLSKNEDEAQATETFSTIIQLGLEKYYDEIDRFLTIWFKKEINESSKSRSFVNLMGKLAELFHSFEKDLDYLLKLKLTTPEILTANKIYHTHICQQFKEYALSRFPLLKDYLFNFNIDCLSLEEKDEVCGLGLCNCLVESIMTEVMDIRKKRMNKRNKKLRRKNRNNSHSQHDTSLPEREEEEEENKFDGKSDKKVDTTLGQEEALTKMKIKESDEEQRVHEEKANANEKEQNEEKWKQYECIFDDIKIVKEKRCFCYCDEEWIAGIASKVWN